MKKTKIRIISIVSIVLIIGTILLVTLLPKKQIEDTNVYINEEIRFADEIFIKVVGLSVEENQSDDGTLDEDGDNLSKYSLNLLVSIEQRNTDNYINKITMKSEMFTLKSVNLESKSKMQVFFNSLASITLQTSLGILAGGAVEGALEYGVLDAIETGLDLTAEYVNQSIENAKTLETDFNPIKATKNQFEPFNPREKMNEATVVKLSFPIKEEYLESKNVIVLSVDKIDKLEKRIFLIPRPV